jgi:hypothetical protein
LLGHREFVLQLVVAAAPGQDVASVYTPVLERLCRRYRVLAARAGDNDGDVDVSFYVELIRDGSLPELARALGQTPGVARANVFHDEEPA